MILQFIYQHTQKLIKSFRFTSDVISLKYNGYSIKYPRLLWIDFGIVFSYIILFLLFIMTYKGYIVEVFGNNGFVDIYYYKYGFVSFVSGLVLVIFFAGLLSSPTTELSNIMLHFHFLLPILPMIVLYSVGGKSTLYLLATIISFIIVFMTAWGTKKQKTLSRCLDHFGLIDIEQASKLVLLVALIYVVLMILFGALNHMNFNIWEVYQHRRESSSRLPMFFTYFSPIVSKAILPIMVVIALQCRHWKMLGFSFSFAVFIFVTTGHKFPLFIPFAIVGLYVLLSLKRPVIAILMAHITLVCAVYFIPGLGKSEQGSRTIGNIILRRAYFTPANINYAYYDFFSKNKKVYWANSKVSMGMITKNYHSPIPKVIGRHQFKKEGLHANSGWLGMGYAHLGFLGMWIYAFFIGFLIYFSDVFMKKTSLPFAGSLLFTPYISLFQAADLPTMLLTHGLFLVLGFAIILKPLKGT